MFGEEVLSCDLVTLGEFCVDVASWFRVHPVHSDIVLQY